MNILTVALTVYMTCCIQAVTAQEETVFSISFNVEGQTVYFNFSDTMFIRFYHCLRNKDHTLCDVQRNTKYQVTTVRACPPVINSQKTDQFTCTPFVNGFVCNVFNYLTGGDDSQCSTPYNIIDNASLSQEVRLTWDGANPMAIENHAYLYGITVSIFGDKTTYTISGTFTSKVTTTASTSTTTTTVKTSRTGAPGQVSTVFSLEFSTITSPGTDKQRSDDDGDDNNMPIIIGAAVGGAVVVAIIVTIVIVLWRRKGRTSLSSKPSGGNYEDTDIYPYGDSTMGNIEPNLRPSNLNTRSEEPTPITYSTVDLNKKLNKTQRSSDTNNTNKLQQKKPRFNQNLDYSEVDIDNDADHYQRSSDVHDGQGIANRVTISPPARPDPFAKSSSYNISSETDEDPSERYSQVVKTNKTKDASAISGNGADSNADRDPSGYEEAVPRTDTQYTTVDPSDKNTPNPAPDGVYAKLHDPVRNITDVYNEWPATDNAGK